jgi:peroxiredoxin
MRCLVAAVAGIVLWNGCVLGAAAGRPATLRDTAGSLHHAEEWAGPGVAVLFFVTTDCPVANSYVPEMNRLRERFAARGVRFLAVQTDTSAPESDVAHYAHEFGYRFPLLLDPRQELVEETGATITPQVAVLSNGKLMYLGRIDDRVVDFGKQHYRARTHDLADALEAVLEGKPVAHPRTRSIGCAIDRVHVSER